MILQDAIDAYEEYRKLEADNELDADRLLMFHVKPMKVILLFSFLFFHFSFALYGQSINNLQWLNVDQEVTEATIGRGITLYAETESIDDGEPVTITVWSRCGGANDLVGRYASRVINNRIAFHWILAFEPDKLPHSQREIDENGYTRPQYYFDIRYRGVESHRSALLAVRVRIRHQVVRRATGEPWRDHAIMMILPDETEVETRTDTEGYVTIENVDSIGEINFYLLEETEPRHKVIQPYREPEKPAYYIIKEEDNNLREIAAYDFICGNPDFWERLYEANRHNFKNDRNPPVLRTGQALIIPPLGNETREGTR